MCIRDRFGIYGFLFSKHTQINQISLGMTVMGIGMLGMLKMVIEMATYQRQQKTQE